MSLDGKVLRRAMDSLEAEKKANEAMYAYRRREVYRKAPRVAEIDAELRGMVAEAAAIALQKGSNPIAAVDAVAKRSLALQAERAELIVAAGYDFDYPDEKPMCLKCADRGFNGSEMCSCLMERYKAEQAKELSKMLKMGEDRFDKFSLDYYDNARGEDGISPREHMELAYDTCMDYAKKFGKRSANLFFTGGTGLGKTFLSTCIARAVSEQSFSVVYDTAVNVFACFEQERFGHGEEQNEDVRRYMDCDLLIIDDLGTEMTTNFVISTLYTIINSRLMSGCKTIINSNLGTEEVRRRYSPQIASRLEGEYLPVRFYGRDIRLQKRGK